MPKPSFKMQLTISPTWQVTLSAKGNDPLEMKEQLLLAIEEMQKRLEDAPREDFQRLLEGV